MSELPKTGSNFVKQSMNYGGTDIVEWSSYTQNKADNYGDQPHHFSRSAFHSPNHIKHNPVLINESAKK